jgi:hypothetical protein
MNGINVAITDGGRCDETKKHSMQTGIKMFIEKVSEIMITGKVQHSEAETDFKKIDENTDERPPVRNGRRKFKGEENDGSEVQHGFQHEVKH